MGLGPGMGCGELLYNGHRVSVGEDEKVLEMDSGDDYALYMYPGPLNRTSKNDENGKFYLMYTLPQKKNVAKF